MRKVGERNRALVQSSSRRGLLRDQARQSLNQRRWPWRPIRNEGEESSQPVEQLDGQVLEVSGFPRVRPSFFYAWP